jgi:hypothetical protein
MKQSTSTNSHGAPDNGATQNAEHSPWQLLKNKRIAYLTLPLLVMATIVEFVILATGWKYQQIVCLPQGMGVIFFGIGPIGATILAVELLKLPLAIWTASRTGWQKGFMIMVGLPLICVLTFQLVKDMAVYEMGVAMKPASEFLEKAATEEIKITQLKAELDNQTKDENGVKAAIADAKADRDRKLAELSAKQAKSKAEIEESLKRNDASRQDAITLTDYQKKELAESEIRQSTLIRQFDADAAQLTKAIAELRARRESELGRATTWNVEEARIENAYKAKLAAYTNKKRAYDKDKAEYDSANFLKRQLMKEPVDPGVPPEREANKILKPTLVAELEEQIKTKEAELVAVNNKRRESVAQVNSDARRLREDFDRRSGTKREETDRKREELLAAMATLVKEGQAEAKQIEQAFEAATKKEQDTLNSQRPLDVVRAELDAARKKADGFYEQREAAIKVTQVHRIATTVEIVRGWLFGERPVSITASAKERGDLLTDQISMVRIWVYPVLAFIVAFLPTLMVEIGFSTVFKPEETRPAYRLGFMGRRLHWLYTRAGRQKILRAERLASEASAEIAVRDRAIATEKAVAEKALFEKEVEVQNAREALSRATDGYEEQMKKKEGEWFAKFTDLADSLNRAVLEKDSLRDLQRSEIERQVQARQNAWSDRMSQMRQELDDQRAAFEAERTALMQEQHRKLMEVTEDCKTQVILARRQMSDVELATTDATARLSHDLKEALTARDTAEAQLKRQSDSFATQLSQAREDAAREAEKVIRHEKARAERQQADFEKTLRQREENFEHRLKQREQELSVALDAARVEEKTKADQEARRREAELERQFEARVREVDARWNHELQQRDEAAQMRLRQREQQVQAQADVRFSELQAQSKEELHRRESELQRQIDAQSREADGRLREEVQQKDLANLARLKQREQELIAKAAARETELQNQFAADLRVREEEWQKQAESRVRAAEVRLNHDAQQKEEIFQTKLHQREQQLQSQFETRQAELQAQRDQEMRGREQEWERNAEAAARATESRLTAEMQQRDELFQSKLRQRDQQWQAKLEAAKAEAQAQVEQELHRRETDTVQAKQREQELMAQLAAQADAHDMAEKQWETEMEIMRANIEPLKVLLVRAEKERDEARQSATEGNRAVQDMEKKLMEASTLLTGWKNGGKNLATARVGREPFRVARDGFGGSSDE